MVQLLKAIIKEQIRLLFFCCLIFMVTEWLLWLRKKEEGQREQNFFLSRLCLIHERLLATILPSGHLYLPGWLGHRSVLILVEVGRWIREGVQWVISATLFKDKETETQRKSVLALCDAVVTKPCLSVPRHVILATVPHCLAASSFNLCIKGFTSCKKIKKNPLRCSHSVEALIKSEGRESKCTPEPSKLTSLLTHFKTTFSITCL